MIKKRKLKINGIAFKQKQMRRKQFVNENNWNGKQKMGSGNGIHSKIWDVSQQTLDQKK